jgi:hypothetical protein
MEIGSSVTIDRADQLPGLVAAPSISPPSFALDWRGRSD